MDEQEEITYWKLAYTECKLRLQSLVNKIDRVSELQGWKDNCTCDVCVENRKAKEFLSSK